MFLPSMCYLYGYCGDYITTNSPLHHNEIVIVIFTWQKVQSSHGWERGTSIDIRDYVVSNIYGTRSSLASHRSS